MVIQNNDRRGWMETKRNESDRDFETAPGRRPWEPMTLRDVGDLRQIVQSGTAKSKPSPGDPGETDKNPQKG